MEIVGRFNSVAEFTASLDNEPRSCWKGTSDCVSEWSVSRQKSWCGATLSESVNFLENGDADAAAKIKAEGNIIAKKRGTGAPNLESSVVGCVPCVPNYLRGVPKTMLKIDRQYPKKPVIDVYVDTTIWDGIDLDKLAIAAAKIANVIAATERAGVRCNLYAMCGCKRDGNYAALFVKIKDSRAPLNLLNIAFPLTNRAFCRMCFLRWFHGASDKYFRNNGSVMSGTEIRNVFNVKGVLLSTSDIVRYGTSIDSIATTINSYIEAGVA